MRTEWCESCDKVQPVRSGRCMRCKERVVSAGGGLKLWRVAVLVLLVVMAAYLYYLPYGVTNKLRIGLKVGDPLLLEETINFPAVRESIKSQVNVAVRRQMESDEKLQDNPFRGLAMTLGSAMVDRTVDSAMTPDGMVMLINKGQIEAAESGNTGEMNPLGNAQLDYQSMDVFTISVQGELGLTRLIMRRNGLTWKVTRIELPIANLR